ncbi:MAG: GDSL-type esterase/lipase family protein [Deltaproteobacteria bacterium]|nr:GDSL-type esterase/lipase family protein [Deltaproteobacteria bacterium]
MKTVIALLGDSLTEWGTFPRSASLPAVELHNLGVAGDGTWGVLARLHRLWDVSPDFVFLMVGVNDLGQGERCGDIVARHNKIWRSVLDYEDPPTLVLHPILPVNPDFFPPGYSALKNGDIFDLNFHLECQAGNLGVPILDFRDPLMDERGKLKAAFTSDGLHLNAEAYKIWDEALCNYLKEKLA